ncbi:MAG: FlgD immunoglobulin-like domain containing protein, partial [bacterium]
FVSGGTLCFKIPLKGVLSAGLRYYFYLWLDGLNGVSGWYNYYTLPYGLYYYVGVPVLTNLNVSNLYWPGGFPYFTNLNYIPICWNVQDGRNIAEVRWKLARGLTPPASATDTTATDSTSGGAFSLAANDTTLSLSCANLLLSSLLQQGYWYAYIWLIDKAGNSSHASAVSFSFKYDLTAPVAPGGVLARSIPATTWFGANSLLGLRINLPQGARDAAAVRWKFKTPPTGSGDFTGSTTLTRVFANGDTASYSVLFNSAVLCGDDTLYYWLADSSGNANFSNRDSTRYRFDMCPPQITRVKSLINNVALVGQAFNDRLLVLDPDAGVDTVWVNYRLGGASTEAPPIPALRVGLTDSFQFTIPLAGVTRRGVEFRATAQDQVTPAYNGPNISNGPTNGPTCYSYDGGGATNANAAADDVYWYPIRSRALGDGDFRIDANGNPVPLVFGDTTNSYQLFSIPYQLDNANVLNALQDDLGAYDPTQWRLFDYLPQSPLASPWQEGANARPFTPGRSYFIITRKPNIVLDSGPGVTRRTVCTDTLIMREGWNLIATPFNFPVHKRSLRLVNANQDTVSLWSFENQWTFTDVMDAWRGYAIYVVRGLGVPVNLPIQLIIQPVAVPGRIGKVSATQLAWQRGEWAVQIAAQANSAQDNYNWAGMRHGAQAGYDALEMAEPPVIGGYVSVSFPRAAWQQPAGSFCTDFRANTGEDQAWEFEVATNQTHSNVWVRFDFLGDFPAGVNVYVMDEALGIVHDLRTKPEYAFRVGSQPVQKKLKLIVGGQEFASKQANGLALVPEKFEVLQNYPNPFNPETSIRYNLSQTAPVRVEIFDQLGRRVRTLVNGEVQQQGYHSKLWDGRDDSGRGVATGIYIYKVTAGKESIAKKMVLQK